TLSLLCRSSVLVLLAVSSASQAQDLHLKKNISSGGYVVSTTETSIKGARERSVTQSPNGSTVTLRQCDLRRTVTMDEANQTYLLTDDPQDENAAKVGAPRCQRWQDHRHDHHHGYRRAQGDLRLSGAPSQSESRSGTLA
ncbi:MAG: hypothetical protein DMG99_15415, partial [Acidobacteria bacterium]